MKNLIGTCAKSPVGNAVKSFDEMNQLLYMDKDNFEMPKFARKRAVCYLASYSLPYEYWYNKQGGIFSKNKMPRGKKFKAAIARFKNGGYVLNNGIAKWVRKDKRVVKMKNLAEILIQELLNDDCTINVVCEGEVDLEQSHDFDAIVGAIHDVDCFASIVAYNGGHYKGQFVVSFGDFEPEETVIDFGVNEYTDFMYNKALEILER